MASLVAACKDDVATAPASSAPAPIVFGVSLRLSGESSASGLAMSTAIRVAEAQVNSVGGIGGRPVSFLFLDDKGDVSDELGATIQTELLDKGAIAILGPISSDQVKEAAKVTDLVVPLISPSATAASLSELNPDPDEKWIYRTIPSDATQVRAMIKFADEGLAGVGGGCKKLAIASASGAYGDGFRRGLVAAWPKVSGASLGAQVTLPTSSGVDTGPLVREIAASDPDCLALVDEEEVGAAFTRALRLEIGREPTLFREGFFVLGADGLNNDGFLVKSRTNPADPSTCTAEGFFGTVPTALEDPAHAEYVALHKQLVPEATRDTLGSYVAGTYDAVALLLLARAASGNDDPAALRAALDDVSRGGRVIRPGTLPDGLIAAAAGEDIDYTGATGSLDFTAEGDVAGGYKVWRVQNGVFTTVGDFPANVLTP